MMGGALAEGATLERPGAFRGPRPVLPGVDGRGRRVSQRYLLVTDGGAAGRAAALWVGAACRDGGASEITLLYVLTPRFRYPMPFEESPSGYAEPLDVALAYESRIAFDDARALLGVPPHVSREVARIGLVEPVVLQAAASGDYHAVVMGRGARTGIAAWLWPDPVRTLWRHLACPLVVVPGEA